MWFERVSLEQVTKKYKKLICGIEVLKHSSMLADARQNTHVTKKQIYHTTGGHINYNVIPELVNTELP